MRKPVHLDIVQTFKDALGNTRQAPLRTISAIDAVLSQSTALGSAPIFLPLGQARSLQAPAEIILEDGTLYPATTTVPRDLPAGYHRLRDLDEGNETKLIVSPGLCYLPAGLREWGLSVQLYSFRSAHSWGMGDLADLRQLARWSARELDAGVLLINPLSAPLPIRPQETSPYFPSSRQYRNLLYLRIEEVAGAAAALADLEGFAAAGRRLNAAGRIDRDAVYELKISALEHLWKRFSGDPAYDRFRKEQGEALNQFAIFSALAEQYRSGWHHWPAEFRDPRSAAVTQWTGQHPERVEFHRWIQWLIDEQLAKAAAEIPLMQDLPIGVNPDGAEAWIWQDVIAANFSVGSPPDEYNTQGQDWGFPPFIPSKIRAAGYEPFIQIVRGVLRHAGGLRIDHVMGLFRLFWIPQGTGPSDGAYVRYPADELLAILALESSRAKAYIVGEDLGTVEATARERLAQSRVLSYKLLWFEQEPPADYPELSLAAVTTHDLPTIAGLWSGDDLARQNQLGLKPNQQGTSEIRERLKAFTGLPDDSAIEEVILELYKLLGQAPSMVLTATLEDLLRVRERPNMPGAPQSSWSLALPETLEAIYANPLAYKIAQCLQRARGRADHAK